VHESITTPAPIDISFRSTVPVGVAVPEALVTVPVKVAGVPIVEEPDAGPTRVTVVPIRVGDFQLASKFATLTEPSPVAKSYPGAALALKAGVVLLAGLTRMPNWLAAVLLQFGLPPTQATELLPLVTS
jgi:hypothetical protein